MKIITRLFLVITLLPLGSSPLFGQGEHPTGRAVMPASAAPEYANIADDDAAMDQAVQKARKNLGKFLAALKSPTPGQTDFAIKRPFVQGGKVEHIWLRDVTYDDKAFHGIVDNAPTEIQNVKLDSKANAAPGEISDWMYVENGRLVGGYTMRALCRKMTPAKKREFEKAVGFRLGNN